LTTSRPSGIADTRRTEHSSTDADRAGTTTRIHAIGRIAPPDVDTFQREYVRRSQPVIIEGLVNQWPALHSWSFAYLREHWGAVEVPIVKLQNRSLGRDPELGLLYEAATLDRAIDLVLDRSGPGYYVTAPLEAGPLRGVFGDVRMPSYCVGKPRLRSRLWVSAGDTVSPLHRDFPDNVFAQVVGRKQFILLPPGDKRRVYPYPMRSKLPQVAAVDPEHPDYDRYPRFRRARPIRVDLGPGDLLYVPGRWWHQVRTVSASVSINWWWATGLVRVLSDLADVYKRIRKVRL
jgi:lysine-specific demethylase 8